MADEFFTAIFLFVPSLQDGIGLLVRFSFYIYSKKLLNKRNVHMTAFHLGRFNQFAKFSKYYGIFLIYVIEWACEYQIPINS